MNIKGLMLKYRRPPIVAAHLFFIAMAYFLSFYARFEFSIPSRYLLIMYKTLPYFIVIKAVAFYYFGLYSGLWRYVSMDDVWRILKANTLSTVIAILCVVFVFGLTGYPRSVFIFDWIICIGLTVGVRFLTRSFREKVRPVREERKKNVLIVGAGAAGISVVRETRMNPHMTIDIVGFIDDNPKKKGLRIHGIKVLGNKTAIAAVARTYQVEEIIIAIPSASGEVIRDIITHCRIPDVKVKIVPGLYRILSGDLEIKLREVKPEDLLGRETVSIDESEVKAYLKGKRVLVTGASGSIGSELCRQIARFAPEEIALFDYNENDMYFLEVELRTKYPGLAFKEIIGDVKDISLLKSAFSQLRPEIVFHAAAFKHVPLMERSPSAAVKNNIISTRNLIYASGHYGVESFVFISTDKAVNPTSIMGATKRLGEMVVQAKAKGAKTKFIAVRFGNVLGSKGSVVPLFRKQIEDGGPVTVTHPEARRYFMSISEAVQLVLQASAMGKGGEIFVLDMGQQIKITDLAEDLISLSGYKPDEDISIVYTGLRPGEKLFEEVLLNVEKDRATKHDKIYVAQPNEFDPKKLRRQIKELERLANLMQEREIVSKIREIVTRDGNGA